MAKLILGIGILATLITGSLYNADVLDERTERLKLQVEEASSLLSLGDTEAALHLLEKAEKEWGAYDGYTGIFVRQGEIDEIYEAFFDYLNSVQENAEDSSEAHDRLIYRLNTLARSEKISLGSIF